MRRLIAGRERPMKSATAERECPAAVLMNQRLRNWGTVRPERCRRRCWRMTRMTRGTVSTRSLAQSKSGDKLVARNNDCMAKVYSRAIASVKYEFGAVGDFQQ